MREFTTAAKAAETDTDREADAIEFPLDGHMLKAYRPGSGQFGVLMAMTNKHASSNEAVAGIITFFCSMLDEDSNTHVINRLLDNRDPLGVEDCQEIMMALVEEWSARPTQSPSDSSASPESTGPSSTLPIPALT